MKKIIKNLLLVAVIALLCAAVSVSAGALTTEDGFTYSVSNNQVTITGYTGTSTDLIIPEEIDGYPVKTIDSYAFEDCTGLTNIEVPKSVTRMGRGVFKGIPNLVSITLPFVGSSRNVEKEAESVFGYIFDYTVLSVASAIQQYFDGGNCRFYIPTSLRSVTITDDVTIPYGAFYNCSFLTSINIPENVSSIGAKAFYNCQKITNFKTSELTIIGQSAFENCIGITSFVIPGGVTVIDYSAFKGCTGLTDVIISEGVTTISSSAFEGCTGLTSVKVPDSVTTLGESVFKNCSNLVDIILPFVGTSRTTDPVSYASVFGFIFGADFSGDSSNDSITITQHYKDTVASRYYIPTSLRSVTITDDETIPYGAFSNCSFLTSINIPEYVTSIGAKAFSNCTGITNVIIPESVTTIGKSAFEGCTGITNVIIPESVTTIGESAFKGCTGFTSVTVPKSVTTLGESVFKNCSNLVNITLPFVGASRTKQETQSAVFGYIFGIDSSAGSNAISQRYREGASSRYFIPTSLRTVTITDDETIPYGAFYNCSFLTSINISENVTSIGIKAFYNCTGITSVTFSESLITVGNYAFYDCTNLKHICYKGNEEKWNNVEIGNNNAVITNPEILHLDFNAEKDITESVIDSTCLVAGSKTTDCSCGYSYGAVALPLAECLFTAYESDGNAGCISDGTKTAFCDYGCGNSYTVTDTGSATGHTYSSVITTPATHLKEGVETFTCACGDSYTESVAKLTEHTYEEVVTAPTCTAKGYTTYTCACGDSYVDNYTDKLAHTYTSVITTPSTHLKEGVATLTCTCGDSYTEPVEKLNEHTYTSAITTPATHLKEGVETFTCACGDSYTKSVAKTPEHANFVETYIIAPTCITEGYTVNICECGVIVNDNYTEKIPHNYNENSVCEECGDRCTCMCHYSGFMGFVWKIVKFFYQIFGANKFCGCGVVHY